MRAATAGTGIALVPLAIARDHLAHGELRQLLGSWQAEPQALYAVYPQHRQASHKLRLLLGFLADRLGRVGC